MFGGKGLGGGRGGNVLRTVGTAVTRAGVSNGGFQEPFSSSSSSTCPSSPTSTAARKPSSSPNLCLSSISSSPFSSPIPSQLAGWPAFNQCDDFDWIKVDDFEDETSNRGFDDLVFGPVPSIDEVQTAVSALHQVFGSVSSYSQLRKNNFPSDGEKDGPDQITSPVVLKHRASSVGSGPDWVEPSADLYNSRNWQIQGADQVYDAFHLLQTEPLIQRMVISLSSDRAVWDAVLNNEVVHELRQSISTDLGEEGRNGNSDKSNISNTAMKVVQWIMSSAKARFGLVFENVIEALKEMFRLGKGEMKNTTDDPFQEKLRTSFLLSVLVLLVVVVSRARGA